MQKSRVNFFLDYLAYFDAKKRSRSALVYLFILRIEQPGNYKSHEGEGKKFLGMKDPLNVTVSLLD